jgi:hypothetical protein
MRTSGPPDGALANTPAKIGKGLFVVQPHIMIKYGKGGTSEEKKGRRAPIPLKKRRYKVL